MLDKQDNLFLTDFGIAKLLEGNTNLTHTGVLMGTPAYMSPELAQSQKVNKLSDIYSLGVILYEMITGRVPFEADTPVAVVIMHVTNPVIPPSQIKPDLSPAIDKLLLKALAKDPNQRFNTVNEFLSAWKEVFATKNNNFVYASINNVQPTDNDTIILYNTNHSIEINNKDLIKNNIATNTNNSLRIENYATNNNDETYEKLKEPSIKKPEDKKIVISNQNINIKNRNYKVVISISIILLILFGLLISNYYLNNVNKLPENIAASNNQKIIGHISNANFFRFGVRLHRNTPGR